MQSVGAILNPEIVSRRRLLFGRAVTLHAFDRGRFIENYRIAVQQFYLAMALIASYALVAAT